MARTRRKSSQLFQYRLDTTREVIPLRQPNGYTCGSTVAAMIGAAVHGRPATDVMALTAKAGTNPRTGTTEIEMARALDAEHVTWRRGRSRSIEALRELVRAGALVALRTDVGVKHWVLIEGDSPDGFKIVCPSMGRTTWSDDYTHAVWSIRDYDHFLVSPRSPSVLRTITDVTRREFVRGQSQGIPETQFSGWEREVIARALERLDQVATHPTNKLDLGTGALDFYRFERNEDEPDIKWLRIGPEYVQSLIATLPGEPDVRVGGVIKGTRVVKPEFRGRGYGIEIALASTESRLYRFTGPSHFSEAGYHTRLKAHEMAVRRAVEAGQTLAPEVLASYPDLLTPDDPDEALSPTL